MIIVEHVNGSGRNTIANDKRLSMKARGLWFILWDYSVNHGGTFELPRFKKEVIGEGEHATKTAFEELQTFGYFVRKDKGCYELRDRSADR